MDDLTKEQQKLLISMYKEVLCRQPALPLEQANYFVDSDAVMDLLLPDASSEHVASLCWALKSKEYVFCTPGDDLANNISLTDKTFIYMENRFKNRVKDILSFLSSLK